MEAAAAEARSDHVDAPRPPRCDEEEAATAPAPPPAPPPPPTVPAPAPALEVTPRTLLLRPRALAPALRSVPRDAGLSAVAVVADVDRGSDAMEGPIVLVALGVAAASADVDTMETRRRLPGATPAGSTDARQTGHVCCCVLTTRGYCDWEGVVVARCCVCTSLSHDSRQES